MGKIDDLYTHPEWTGIIDLADVTNWELVDHPDTRPDAEPGKTVKTLRLFFKSILQTRDVLQGDLAEKVFHDLQQRIIQNVRDRYPTIEEECRPETFPNPIRTKRRRGAWRFAYQPPVPSREETDKCPIVTAPPPLTVRPDGKPGGLTHEQAKALRDSYIPQAEARKEELFMLGITDRAGNVQVHPFKPKYNDIVERQIDVCEWCDRIGADPKHEVRMIMVYGDRYDELYRLRVIDRDRHLTEHGFNPKTDIGTGRPVDLCQYCEMPSGDKIHGKSWEISGVSKETSDMRIKFEMDRMHVFMAQPGTETHLCAVCGYKQNEPWHN